MTKTSSKKSATIKLGINGFGRIGKLTLWHHISRKYFKEIVVNLGRDVGESMNDLAHYIERDSTYGWLHVFLGGHKAERVIEKVDEKTRTLVIDGIKVKMLNKARNPMEIDWSGEGVKLVVETTGQFLDPTLPADSPKGSCLGHIEAGADKVVVSAPFKIKDKSAQMPEYAVTTVMGINPQDYHPRKHKVISGASCTTTCLAHMVKPLLDHFGAKRIMTASMDTIHAVTSSQSVLDRLPKAGATDLRKTRSMMDNIILTSTV
ncbi:MAG: glyceraldehyde-3-phosphate dehydrogenase, partial [Proteobacteria bacterium]|nr:glyceraldehyde-3-phosphate dehydrogenase [Pseudomonadota bacterium]